MQTQNLLDLDYLRGDLASIEDLLIISLFCRSRYKANNIIYVPKVVEIPWAPEFDGSFLDYYLWRREQVDAEFGRYQRPDELPFSDKLPAPTVKRNVVESPLKVTGINLNPKIKRIYIDSIPYICGEGDDGEHGSSVEHDVTALQTISRRVHLGLFVAESKFLDEPDAYIELAKAGDEKAIRKKITNESVEKDILERVSKKGGKYEINPEFISRFYRNEIIPITKDAEVRYLLERGRQA